MPETHKHSVRGSAAAVCGEEDEGEDGERGADDECCMGIIDSHRKPSGP